MDDCAPKPISFYRESYRFLILLLVNRFTCVLKNVTLVSSNGCPCPYSLLLSGKLKKGKRKKKRGEGEFSGEGRPHVTKIFAKFSHDAPLPMLKKKHLTVEQLNARRRKVWLTIAKKEFPKVRWVV